jgi:hypothetical protein
MKRLPTLLTMAVAGLLLHCGDTTTGTTPTNTTDRQVGVYGSPPPLERYISWLQQGYRDYLRRGIFFFQGMTPPDELAYKALAHGYAETGLEGLSTGDRQTLLLVAQIAFISYADTLRYSVAAVGDDRNEAGGILEEVYSLHQERSIAARHFTGTGVSWPWPLWPHQDPDSPSETVQLFDRPTDRPGGGWFVPETVWNKQSQTWSCLNMEIDDITWAFGYDAYLENLRGLGLGVLLERDAVEGRPAYKFSGVGAEQRDLIYWLDAETLWLRQYEYELDGIRYTVKLEAVNEDIHIEPPDVDVPCVEETPSP